MNIQLDLLDEINIKPFEKIVLKDVVSHLTDDACCRCNQTD